jgi:hypothetical protein
MTCIIYRTSTTHDGTATTTMSWMDEVVVGWGEVVCVLMVGWKE